MQTQDTDAITTRYTQQELAVFDRLHIPVWVFDVQQQKIWWANQVAIELWDADSLETLRARSFKDMSEVTVKRLQIYLEQFTESKQITERWNLYPNGRVTTLDCVCSGIYVHPDNRLMILIEGKIMDLADSIEQDTLRIVEGFRHLPTIISLFSINGQVILQNPAADTAFGADELNRFHQRFMTSQQAEQVWGAILHGQPYSGEHAFQTLHGIQQHGIDGRLIHDPVTGIVAVLINQREITQRTAIEAQLKSAEERFELAMLGVRDGLWDHNLVTGQIYYSPRWKEMLGYSDSELQGQNLWEELVHPADFVRVRSEARAYLARKIPKFECVQRMRHKDGHYIWILTRGSAIWNDTGVATRFIGTHVDLTAQKAIESQLQQAKEAAEIASRAKSEFMATMSHEIRTPLNGILGMAELLSKTTTVPTEQRYALQIHASGKSLLTLINEILDFSKIEAGKLQLEHIAFNLPLLVKEVMDLFTPSAENKGLRINCVLHPELPIWLMGDPCRLRQILNNLLGNAIKFTAEGKVKLKIDVLHHRETMSTLRFEVTDTGVGIEPYYHQHLFEPFSQADTSVARKYGGSGLGLTISRRLVEMMQGDLGFNSYPGKGSTFWFNLPLSHAPPTAIPTTPSVLDCSTGKLAAHGSDNPTPTDKPSVLTADEHAPPHIEKPILLVEDDMVNQEVAKVLLELAGFKVTVAKNGVEALNYCQQQTFQAILMDCQMPEMDGLTATQKIRQAEARANRAPIPIIALTANAMQGDKERCLTAGMDDYLSKPFDSDQLQAKLRLWSARLKPYTPLPIQHQADLLSLKPTLNIAQRFVQQTQIVDEQQLDQLREQMGDNLPRLLSLYHQTIPSYLAEIDDALTKKQAALVHKAAHRLKSASKNVGTLQVVKLCEQLEELAIAESLDTGMTVLTALQDALRHAEVELRRWS